MLHLTTAASERLGLPAYAIIAVMKPVAGNPCAIIFDMGAGDGPQVDQLSDQYGFVKKLVVDAQALVNPIEVREVTPEGQARLFFARERIVGRREVKPCVGGINATLFVNLLGKVTALQVADTLDELDGVEPAPAVALPAFTGGE